MSVLSGYEEWLEWLNDHWNESYATWDEITRDSLIWFLESLMAQYEMLLEDYEGDA